MFYRNFCENKKGFMLKVKYTLSFLSVIVSIVLKSGKHLFTLILNS